MHHGETVLLSLGTETWVSWRPYYKLREVTYKNSIEVWVIYSAGDQK